jgi:signal peptidase I
VSRVRRIVFGADPRRTTVRILVLGAIAAAMLLWVILPVRTDGDSMLPTYTSGSFNVVNRLAYFNARPKRGDIIAIRLAGTSVVIIKRIIALPGERISVSDGSVRINDSPLDEPYVRHNRSWNLEEVTLGPGEYFVAGDNREASDVGRTDAERIVGRLMF